MNITLKLKIKLLDNTIIKSTASVLLLPFYVTEEDVYSLFSDKLQIKSNQLRQVIFNCSLTALKDTKKIELYDLMQPLDLYFLRRDYTLCLVSNNINRRLVLEMAPNTTRSKRLGDFSVSTSNKSDSAVGIKLLSESNICLEETKKLIKEIETASITPAFFVKGSANRSSTNSSRLWWLKEYDPYRSNYTAVDAFASIKKYSVYNNTLLMKTGVNLCFNNQRSYLARNCRISF